MKMLGPVDEAADLVTREFAASVVAVPSGSVLTTATTTRPTNRTDVVVIFTGSDPGGNALDGDYWIGA